MNFGTAVLLIGSGLFKKVVVSSYLSEALVDDVFANPSEFSSLEILVAVYGYAVQIYADFSGYTDIANRHSATPRLSVPAELRPALHLGFGPGLLASVAHEPVALAPRLPVLPTGRQPTRHGLERIATC